ncbi:uncharacterized protein LOC115447202 isoform X1 [Manduca sexta]|nr:uncharacterized protein LOC115447202 isoform X1 [Manduca sexta]
MSSKIEPQNKSTRINMACASLDPRSGSSCGQCLGSKVTNYVLGYLQTVLWFLCFIGFVSQTETTQSKEFVMGVIAGLLMITFAIIFVVGLHKDRRSYIKAYLIFCAVMTIFLILGFFVNLFTQPARIGLRGFIGNLVMITLNIITFIAVRAFSLTDHS